MAIQWYLDPPNIHQTIRLTGQKSHVMGVLPVTTMYCHPFVRAEHPLVASSVVEALHPVEVRPLCQAEQERLGQGRPVPSRAVGSCPAIISLG